MPRQLHYDKANLLSCLLTFIGPARRKLVEQCAIRARSRLNGRKFTYKEGGEEKEDTFKEIAKVPNEAVLQAACVVLLDCIRDVLYETRKQIIDAYDGSGRYRETLT